MAIRFDKEFRKEIRREIDKVNKKFARARKIGYTNVPQNIRLSEIKSQFSSRYATRREVRRQIAAYKKADISDMGKVVELETGQRISLYTLKEAERKNTRLLRKVNRDIKRELAYLDRAGGKDLPFGEHQQRLNRLYDIQETLREGVRASDSNLREVNELYAREYSTLKKDSFEDAFFNTLDQHLDFSDLTDKEKAELKAKLHSLDIDSLIDANRYDDDLSEILDRYVQQDAYNDKDKKVIKKGIRDLYNNIDNIVEKYNV